MGVVTWYIFVIWFFSGFFIAIGSASFGIMLGGFGMLFLLFVPLGGYISWKSLDYARMLLIIESEKTTKEIIIINSLFVLSVIVLYISFFEFSGFSTNFITHYIFISTTTAFILFKTFMLRVFRISTKK